MSLVIFIVLADFAPLNLTHIKAQDYNATQTTLHQSIGIVDNLMFLLPSDLLEAVLFFCISVTYNTSLF